MITNKLTFDPPTRLPELTQNLIRSSHGHSTPSLKISCKSVQPFSRNVADKETKKETNRPKTISRPPTGGGVIKYIWQIFFSETKLRYTNRRVAAVDDSHVVCVDIDASRPVDVLETNADMLTARLAITQVSEERPLHGTVRSRRTGPA